MGYKEKKTAGIPKRRNRIGYRESKTEEIPKEMKCFGYKESENGRNTQRDEMFWV